MADWMSQMANAVDEAEAANALPPDEVPTEPATTPRSQSHDAPRSTRVVEELQLPSLEYGPRPEPERFATRFILNDVSMPLEREKGNVQKLQNMKHINGVSKNGKLRSRPVSLTMQHFHVVPLLKELRRCVCFQMSMRPFVRMIQR